MKEVFVVLYESVYDGEFDTRVELFANESEATKRMDMIVEEFKENDSLVSFEDFVEEVSDNSTEECIHSYCGYEDGAYSENHLCVSVLKKEIFSSATDMLGV